MCFEWFCLIQPAVDSPPAMCPASVWRCGDIMLSLHPRLGRLHAHHCGHDFGIITEVEHRKIDVRLRSHAFCAANYYYADPYSTAEIAFLAVYSVSAAFACFAANRPHDRRDILQDSAAYAVDTRAAPREHFTGRAS